MFLECHDPYTITVPQEISMNNAHNFYLDEEGVLYYEDPEAKMGIQPGSRLVIPDTLREEILKNLHDCMGHFGFQRTYANIRMNYFWPLMYTQIEDYI